jgi:hypothetical protein
MFFHSLPGILQNSVCFSDSFHCMWDMQIMHHCDQALARRGRTREMSMVADSLGALVLSIGSRTLSFHIKSSIVEVVSL